jgi:hypothetical protein
MRRFGVITVIVVSALALLGGNAANAANGNASCEGVFASLVGPYAPGGVASLTHQLQAEASTAGVPMGQLNLLYAQTKGVCF